MLKRPTTSSHSGMPSVHEARRLLLPLTTRVGRGPMAKVMTNEEEEDLAGDLIEGAASRDSRRNAAKRRHETQSKRYLNEAVATAVADLYLVQAEIDVHYFHIGNALHTVEKRRVVLLGRSGDVPPLDADLSQLRGGDDGALARRTEDSNEAFKLYLRSKAKGSWELKTTVELILQSTTSSSLDAAAALSIRNIMHQDRLAAGGKHTTGKAGKDVAGEKVYNSNPYDFSFKTLAHLAKVDEHILNTKVRVGAPSHLLFDNREHPLMYVADKGAAEDKGGGGATPVTATSRDDSQPDGEVYEGATTHTLVHLQKYLFMKTNELARVGHIATMLGYGWVGAAERASTLDGFPSLNTEEVLTALQHGCVSSGPLWQEVSSRCTGALPNRVQSGAKVDNVACGNVADVLTTYHSMGPVPEQPDALFADDEILLAAAAAGVNLGKGAASPNLERQGGGGPSMKTETAARLQVSRMRGQMRQQAGKEGSLSDSQPGLGSSRVPKRRSLLGHNSRPPSTGPPAVGPLPISGIQPPATLPPRSSLPNDRIVVLEDQTVEGLSMIVECDGSASSSDNERSAITASTDFLLNKDNRKARRRKAKGDRDMKKHDVITATRIQYRPYEKRELLADRVRRERAATPVSITESLTRPRLPMIASSSIFDNSQLQRIRRGDGDVEEVPLSIMPTHQQEPPPPPVAAGDPEDDICWGVQADERPALSPPAPHASDVQDAQDRLPAKAPVAVVSDGDLCALKDRISAQCREIFDLKQSLLSERLQGAALQREVGRANTKLTLFQTIQRHLADVNEIGTLCELGCTSAAAALLGEVPEVSQEEDTQDLLAAIRFEFHNAIQPIVDCSSPAGFSTPTPSNLGASVLESSLGQSVEVELDTRSKKGPQFAQAVAARVALPPAFQQRLVSSVSVGECLRQAGGCSLLLFSGGVFAAMIKEHPFGRLLALHGQRIQKESAASMGPRRVSGRMSIMDTSVLPQVPGLVIPPAEANRILDNIVINGEQLAGDRRSALEEFLAERKSVPILDTPPPLPKKKQAAPHSKKSDASQRRLHDASLSASQPHPFDGLSPRSVALSRRVKDLLDGMGGRGITEGSTFSGLSLPQQEAKVAEWCQQYASSPHLRNIVKVQNALIEMLVSSLVQQGHHPPPSELPVRREITMSCT